jgi:hypothetical protein
MMSCFPLTFSTVLLLLLLSLMHGNNTSAFTSSSYQSIKTRTTLSFIGQIPINNNKCKHGILINGGKFYFQSCSKSYRREVSNNRLNLFATNWIPTSFISIYTLQQWWNYFSQSVLQGISAVRPTIQQCSSSSSSSTAISFLLTRTLFLRAMAFIHCIAFLIAYNQNKGLIGDNGITPARTVLDTAQHYGELKGKRRLEWRLLQSLSTTTTNPNSRRRSPPILTQNNNNNILDLHFIHSIINYIQNRLFAFQRVIDKAIDSNKKLLMIRQVLWDRSDKLNRPTITLLWLAKNRSNLNRWLDWIAISGFITSALVMCTGLANVPMIFILWLCQRSLMSVGQVWYGYGWEPQLNELSFHTLFLVPLLNPFQTVAVPPLIVWLLRWHLFRIIIGSGLLLSSVQVIINGKH